MAYPGLSKAALRIGVELDEEHCRQLDVFVCQLEKWNNKFNLLSRRDVDRLWTRHVLDSLSVLPLLPVVRPGCPALRLLDLGTGAGFPGLPLAIAAPALEVVLVDRNARKIRFLDLVVAELGLRNVSTHCGDVSDTLDLKPVDVLVSRAVASPNSLWALGQHLLNESGVMVLMTGVETAGADNEGFEVATISEQSGHMAAAYDIEASHRIEIPGLDRAHRVDVIRRKDEEDPLG